MTESLEDAVFRIKRSRRARVDAVVHPTWCGLVQIVKCAPGNHATGLHQPPSIVNPASRDVDHGAWLHHDRLASLKSDRSTRSRQFTDAPLDDPCVTRDVSKR